MVIHLSIQKYKHTNKSTKRSDTPEMSQISDILLLLRCRYFEHTPEMQVLLRFCYFWESASFLARGLLPRFRRLRGIMFLDVKVMHWREKKENPPSLICQWKVFAEQKGAIVANLSKRPYLPVCFSKTVHINKSLPLKLGIFTYLWNQLNSPVLSVKSTMFTNLFLQSCPYSPISL